jgi:hypothetical protein
LELFCSSDKWQKNVSGVKGVWNKRKKEFIERRNAHNEKKRFMK